MVRTMCSISPVRPSIQTTLWFICIVIIAHFRLQEHVKRCCWCVVVLRPNNIQDYCKIIYLHGAKMLWYHFLIPHYSLWSINFDVRVNFITFTTIWNLKEYLRKLSLITKESSSITINVNMFDVLGIPKSKMTK